MEMNTMKDIIDYAAEKYGTATVLKYKVKKELVEKSYIQLKKDIEAFSRTLEKLGLLGKHVALIGTTTYEWIVSYFGITNSGGVVVPVDVGLPAPDVWELINRADVEALVYDEIRKDVAAGVRDNCKEVRQVISMQAVEDSGEILSLSGCLAENQGEFQMELDPDKLCAILFTSGTTGKSKGVMLTHRNLTDNAVCLDMKIPEGTVSMTVLPIHHAYCFTMDILKGIYIGMEICVNDSIMHVSKNLQLFKPEIILLVPMVIESIYGKLRDATGDLPKEAVAKVALGGRLHTICSGGAYLPPELVGCFAEYGITVLQGYGMTECSPVISTNLHWESKTGSVGKVMPNCQVKIVDEEIWVKGSSVMQGYYKMPKETEETLVDGWLRTGDLGYVDEDNFIYITGRKKNLIILKNGENVSPEELENEIVRSPLVKEVIVREKENSIEAEIFPDLEYMEKQGIPDVRPLLQEVIDDYNTGKPIYKKIHGLIIREEEFPKTPSKKIKRS